MIKKEHFWQENNSFVYCKWYLNGTLSYSNSHKLQVHGGSVIIDEGSKPEILDRIKQTTAALTRLKPIWNDRSISLSSKTRLMCSLVTSIFLYARES